MVVRKKKSTVFWVRTFNKILVKLRKSQARHDGIERTIIVKPSVKAKHDKCYAYPQTYLIWVCYSPKYAMELRKSQFRIRQIVTEESRNVLDFKCSTFDMTYIISNCSALRQMKSWRKRGLDYNGEAPTVVKPVTEQSPYWKMQNFLKFFRTQDCLTVGICVINKRIFRLGITAGQQEKSRYFSHSNW